MTFSGAAKAAGKSAGLNALRGLLGFPEILTNSRFYLELLLEDSNDYIDGSFMDCSGFQQTQEVIEIREVTPQLWGKKGNSKGRIVQTKMPGNSSCTNITLKRGLTLSRTFWQWLEKVEDGDWAGQKRDGSLVIYDQMAISQFRFEFTGAWPVSYKISDLSVQSGDYNIEEVEIAVETLKRVDPFTTDALVDGAVSNVVNRV
jgi:phage tail-like protein